MKKYEIKAVEMTRRIRDNNYEKLRNKSVAERIIFYREKAKAFHTQIERLSLNKQNRYIQKEVIG